MQTHPAPLYRKLPQVGELLHRSDFLRLQQTYSRELIAGPSVRHCKISATK